MVQNVAATNLRLIAQHHDPERSMGMTRKGTDRGRHRPATLACLLALGCGAAAAHAELLGMYVGGAVGQARIEAAERSVATSVGSVSTGSFAENHSAFKVMAGLRALSFVGAEVE